VRRGVVSRNLMHVSGKLLFVGANFNRAVVAQLSRLTLSTLVQIGTRRLFTASQCCLWVLRLMDRHRWMALTK
jgi:hypothetical protein